MKDIFNIALLFFFTSFLHAQELPPIENFPSSIYNAGNQNWMISQADNKYIYIANNDGLLEYDGSRWLLYPSPNNTIIRAVKVVKEKIFTGAYMEFGFWEKDPKGKLIYSSLLPLLSEKMLEDEHIWNIVTFKEWVLFRSLNRIYFYNTNSKKFNIIKSNNAIINVYIVDNQVYYNVSNEGIYIIKAGKPELIIKEPLFDDELIVKICQKDNDLLLLTKNSGFYIYKENRVIKWNTEVDELLSNFHIYSSLQIQNGGILLGTIANGLIYLDKNGKLLYHFDQDNGLNNNTILSIYEDIDNNIWVGLDDGLNCINIDSAIKIYNDKKGKLGTVYASIVYQDYLYLGTNQGLFYKKLGGNEEFQFMQGTTGQVWSVFEYKDYLFCGHHKGTFQILNNKAKMISDIPGTWNFKEIPDLDNHLLQGNYNGLYVISKKKDDWALGWKVKGFDYSARFFEPMSNNDIWINHGYRGVFNLHLDLLFKKVKSVYKDSSVSLSRNTSLVKFNNDLFYENSKGIFVFDTLSNKFIKDTLLTPLVSGNAYFSGKLVVDRSNKLWLFSKESIIVVSVDNLSNKYKYELIDIPALQRKANTGYENVAHLGGDIYLLGTSNGYIKLDLKNTKGSKSFKLFLREVIINPLGAPIKNMDLDKSGDFSFKQNSIVFKFSVPRYSKYLKVKYQYKLKGYYDEWSNWTDKSEVRFDNLSFGDYVLEIRSKIGSELSTNTINYQFKINRPWFLSNVALGVYGIISILFIFLIHRSYKRYYNKKHKDEQLENERLIMKINNDNLKMDIENKNREMAISMMNIVKRNKMLNQIKKELNEIDSYSLKVKSVLNLINQNLNNKNDLEKFEKAFNNTDKHFMDRLKEKHPNLSPNDLRFCAYLRLNLSSKEIAPLLNITVRSVEIKRYRLRKKMNLPHDAGLIDHILSV